jgi:hypothetical protein
MLLKELLLHSDSGEWRVSHADYSPCSKIPHATLSTINSPLSTISLALGCRCLLP